MKLMKLSQFRKEYFVAGSAPDIKTIKRAIEMDELPGKQIGNLYYIDISRLSASNNPLVNKVLAA